MVCCRSYGGGRSGIRDLFEKCEGEKQKGRSYWIKCHNRVLVIISVMVGM